MAKAFALVAVLLLGACSNNDPTAPITDVGMSEPLFAHAANGCPTALSKTTGTPGAANVTAACARGE